MQQSRMPRRLRYSLTRLGQSYRGAGMRCHWPRMVLDWSGRQRLCSLSTCSAQAIPHRSRVCGHIDRDVIRNPGPSASARRWPHDRHSPLDGGAESGARLCAVVLSERRLPTSHRSFLPPPLDPKVRRAHHSQAWQAPPPNRYVVPAGRGGLCALPHGRLAGWGSVLWIPLIALLHRAIA